MIPPPPSSPLFPYTTLFRSGLLQRPRSAVCDARLERRHVDLDSGGIHGHDLAFESQRRGFGAGERPARSEEHTSELQSLTNLVCRLLLEKKKKKQHNITKQT